MQQVITKRIQTSIKALTKMPTFEKWLLAQSPAPGSVVLINNSFVYRDKLQTTKSELYPAVDIDARGSLQASDIRIVSGHTINADFKLIGPQAQKVLVSRTLMEASKHELKQLGHVVFLLIGEVQDTVVSREAVASTLFKEIILDPTAKSPLTLTADQITVRSIVDEESLWPLLAQEYGKPLPDELTQPFATALQKLKAKDHAILRVPARSASPQAALIDSWGTALKENIAQYRAALQSSKGVATHDPDAFNSVLRIAYNFASDAIHLIRLLISICDVKPLIRWCTSVEWFQLAEAFKELPWSRLKGKPSLEIYQQTINGARNHAFHNLLLIEKTLQAEMTGSALGTVRLRLFSEYSRRTEEKFDYQDRVLVQILTEFTRAAEQSVSADFWTRNLAVMDATVALLTGVSRTLKTLNKTLGPAR